MLQARPAATIVTAQLDVATPEQVHYGKLTETPILETRHQAPPGSSPNWTKQGVVHDLLRAGGEQQEISHLSSFLRDVPKTEFLAC